MIDSLKLYQQNSATTPQTVTNPQFRGNENNSLERTPQKDSFIKNNNVALKVGIGAIVTTGAAAAVDAAFNDSKNLKKIFKNFGKKSKAAEEKATKEAAEKAKREAEEKAKAEAEQKAKDAVRNSKPNPENKPTVSGSSSSSSSSVSRSETSRGSSASSASTRSASAEPKPEATNPKTETKPKSKTEVKPKDINTEEITAEIEAKLEQLGKEFKTEMSSIIKKQQDKLQSDFNALRIDFQEKLRNCKNDEEIEQIIKTYKNEIREYIDKKAFSEEEYNIAVNKYLADCKKILGENNPIFEEIKQKVLKEHNKSLQYNRAMKEEVFNSEEFNKEINEGLTKAGYNRHIKNKLAKNRAVHNEKITAEIEAKIKSIGKEIAEKFEKEYTEKGEALGEKLGKEAEKLKEIKENFEKLKQDLLQKIEKEGETLDDIKNMRNMLDEYITKVENVHFEEKINETVNAQISLTKEMAEKMLAEAKNIRNKETDKNVIKALDKEIDELKKGLEEMSSPEGYEKIKQELFGNFEENFDFKEYKQALTELKKARAELDAVYDGKIFEDLFKDFPYLKDGDSFASHMGHGTKGIPQIQANNIARKRYAAAVAYARELGLEVINKEVVTSEGTVRIIAEGPDFDITADGRLLQKVKVKIGNAKREIKESDRIETLFEKIDAREYAEARVQREQANYGRNHYQQQQRRKVKA